MGGPGQSDIEPRKTVANPFGGVLGPSGGVSVADGGERGDRGVYDWLCDVGMQADQAATDDSAPFPRVLAARETRVKLPAAGGQALGWADDRSASEGVRAGIQKQMWAMVTQLPRPPCQFRHSIREWSDISEMRRGTVRDVPKEGRRQRIGRTMGPQTSEGSGGWGSGGLPRGISVGLRARSFPGGAGVDPRVISAGFAAHRWATAARATGGGGPPADVGNAWAPMSPRELRADIGAALSAARARPALDWKLVEANDTKARCGTAGAHGGNTTPREQRRTDATDEFAQQGGLCLQGQLRGLGARQWPLQEAGAQGPLVGAPAAEEVAMTTLDHIFGEYLAVNGSAPALAVDVLKLDVEGYEMGALRGAEGLLSQGLVHYLVVEFHPGMLGTTGTDPQGLLEFLQHYCFVCHSLKIDRPHTFSDFVGRYTASADVLPTQGL
ncbi:unnamed protein product, partial [Prorocentrum cordatum]